MLKKLIVFPVLYFLFSFSYASIGDPDKGKDSEKGQKCKKKYGATVEREFKKSSHYIIVEEEQQEKIAEEENQESSSKEEQNADIHSFNFLYYLIHHYKFSDFITQ